ncbi:rCG63352 [Rattus norvegicus]|uniref:RCG63352 n=1 Tax=Rattus norvegicus TaxID=10116 RepID=A6J7C5_RAT|nr:rCG63352 [Rattus norvegicus]
MDSTYGLGPNLASWLMKNRSKRSPREGEPWLCRVAEKYQ